MHEQDLKMIKEYMLQRKEKIALDFFLECRNLPEGSAVPEVDRGTYDALDKLVKEIDYELETKYPKY